MLIHCLASYGIPTIILSADFSSIHIIGVRFSFKSHSSVSISLYSYVKWCPVSVLSEIYIDSFIVGIKLLLSNLIVQAFQSYLQVFQCHSIIFPLPINDGNGIRSTYRLTCAWSETMTNTIEKRPPTERRRH